MVNTERELTPNECAMYYLTGDNVWVYEREGGDCGIVVANSYEEALDELRKVYDDIDDRLSRFWGITVKPIMDYTIKGNVIITTPY